MLYLATPPTPERRALYRDHDLGVMLTPRTGMKPGNTRHYNYWAADNACFAQGDRFDPDDYLAWLGRMSPWAATCLFATAPDVFGDAAATLARSRPLLEPIRAAGFPVAFVGQLGFWDSLPDWDSFDCLFIGGPDEWQKSEACYEAVQEAKRRGKWTHRGRVNSERRLRLSAVMGYDSADGTMTAFAPDRNIAKLVSWLASLRGQARLFDDWDNLSSADGGAWKK